MSTTRRDFVKIGFAAAFIAGCGDDDTPPGPGPGPDPGGVLVSATLFNLPEWADLLNDGSYDYRGPDGDERKAIPSACWQCVCRDAIVGFVANGRLESIQGNPRSLRTNGKCCPRGQGGVGQAYDPDRLLFPMRQTVARGDINGWERVSWEDALAEIVAKIKPLRDAGTPEKFMFHYGRMKASASTMIKSFFLPAYGTKTISNHTSICEGGKWTAQELTWGKHYDVNDVDNTNFILNFGCNPMEAHTNHLPFTQRLVDAMSRGIKMYTFDVRLSNTAARSTEWLPIKPGADLAVLLAMCNYIMNTLGDEYLDAGFIDKWTGTTVADLKNHLATANEGGPYTAAWAEGISGVPAAKIEALATEFAEKSFKKNGTTGATVITYRGAVCHYNGVQTERAAMLLEGICGNIDQRGGRIHGVGASWKYSYKVTAYPDTPSALPVLTDNLRVPAIDFPTHGASHRVLATIAAQTAENRPEVYMTYCYNAAYANGDCAENVKILKDKTVIPYSVAVDVSYGEGTALADLVIPDATYLERWDFEDMVSMKGIKEFYIRQPLITPVGGVRDFKDVIYTLAELMGFEENLGGWSTAEEFIEDACNTTPEIVAAAAAAEEPDGFTFMKKYGAWQDDAAVYPYASYDDEVVVDPDWQFDAETGAYFDGDPGDTYSYKHYQAQKIGDKAYKGFKPDKISKGGLCEFFSKFLEDKGKPPMPTWQDIPEFEDLGANLVLTTYKVSTQTHSRTQNCKYLSEIYHDNPAWINPTTAAALGIDDEATIKITNLGRTSPDGTQATEQAYITTTVRVTDQVAEGVVAVSHHCGHWNYGRYATAGQQAAPLGDEAEREVLAAEDPDLALIFWKGDIPANEQGWNGPSANGVHPNWIIPNDPEPTSGQLRFFDTVVSVEKV